jgi:hypothetical protein
MKTADFEPTQSLASWSIHTKLLPASSSEGGNEEREVRGNSGKENSSKYYAQLWQIR